MRTQTHQGNKYFILFIDDYSRKVHVYFIKEKSKAFNILLNSKPKLKMKPVNKSKYYGQIMVENTSTDNSKIIYNDMA